MIPLGINVPNFGPTADPETLLGWARFAEEGGFALAMVSDHVAPTAEVTALYPDPFYDPFTTLAWFAGQTTRIALGTTVTILPYRHPLLTARVAANIDRFTGGRFVLGVGVGWSEQEFAALGIPFRERGRITDEYLAAITGAWSGARASLDGEYVRYHDVRTGPSPARTPHPPVWVGGTSPAAIRRAVRFGDAWHPNNAGLQWLRDTGLPALRAAAETAGRPVPAFAPRMRARLTARDLPADRPAGVGSMAQVADDVCRLAELGATYVVLDTNPDHPDDRRPAEEDWDTLSRVAEHLGRPPSAG
ncbi:MAG TPA: TIGR03619 family F420-dependent LLM class oxidoreductase [Acidimicrobiales bacterium]